MNYTFLIKRIVLIYKVIIGGGDIANNVRKLEAFNTLLLYHLCISSGEKHDVVLGL